MNKLDIKSLNLNKKIGEGKESIVYDYGDKVIKIFKSENERTSPFKRISDEGLIKLQTLPLKHFNKPVDIIYDNLKILGYTENKLEIDDLNEKLSVDILNEIKEDIICLSYSGFKIDDIFYNYTSFNNFMFFDMTSYSYVNSEKRELLDFYYQKNIATINTFLVGLNMFNAYRHGSKNELTKTFKANEFINKNIGNEYYGDYIRENSMKM